MPYTVHSMSMGAPKKRSKRINSAPAHPGAEARGSALVAGCQGLEPRSGAPLGSGVTWMSLSAMRAECS